MNESEPLILTFGITLQQIIDVVSADSNNNANTITNYPSTDHRCGKQSTNYNDNNFLEIQLPFINVQPRRIKPRERAHIILNQF